MMHNDTVEGTQTGYCSSLRHWVNFNLEIDEDPFEFPIDPYKVMFWIHTRFEESGSIKSIKTWKAVINWICKIAGQPPSYKIHPDYTRYIKSLYKHHSEEADHRMPFTLHHICKYIKHLMNVKNPGLKEVTKATLSSMYFMTMSRPSELVQSVSALDRLKGIRIKHFERLYDKAHDTPMLKFRIETFKNQKSRKLAKFIYIAPTRCSRKNDCLCRYMDPYALFLNLMKFRDNLVTDLLQQLKLIKCPLEYNKMGSIIKKLMLEKENHVFVHENGEPITTKFLPIITNEISKVNGILNSDDYTPYSFRIGGTTRASRAHIPHPTILRYVGWSMSRLQDGSQMYIRLAPWSLATVPYDMVHPKKPLKDSAQVYDPWTAKLGKKYYR